MAKTFTVTAPLVQARTSDGKVHYFYQYAELPDGLLSEDVDRLVELGFVTEKPDPDLVIKGAGFDPANAGIDRPAPKR